MSPNSRQGKPNAADVLAHDRESLAHLKTLINGEQHYIFGTDHPGAGLAFGVFALGLISHGESGSVFVTAQDVVITNRAQSLSLTVLAVAKSLFTPEQIGAVIDGIVGNKPGVVAATIQKGRDIIATGNDAEVVAGALDAISRGAGQLQVIEAN